ncbi:TlpA disulfide reductase family protein [Marinigracilibium pacificum]|uniref:AhpC/TSA family protein n=1 Tax=Marinigracilibium pacificum TaxID=2729599 RepID=A0A848IXJ1_9BACT|nr:TlpA disulfide reductase family protein [Marinigracilibium pacificum]NMM49243.1 AhpC/TSA family protein [Marinigracilibium pacificum]
MNILKYGSFIFSLLLIVACGGENEEEKTDGAYSGTIKGKVQNFEDVKQILLSKQENNRFIVFDTLKLNENGEFSAEVSLIQPSFVALNLGNNEQIFIPYDGDDVSITIDMNDPISSAKVEGSDDYDYYTKISDMMKEFQLNNRDLMLSYQQNASENNMEVADSLAQLIQSKQAEFQTELKTEIRNMLPSIVALEAARLLPLDQNIDLMNEVVSAYEESYPNADFYMPVKDELAKASKLAIGAMAPDFSLPTPEGDSVSLSDFRGEYVLVDFWAQWCKPCRMENPNVVAAYNKYHEKGFQILGVSLDRSRDKWLQAIEEDNLTWTQVSELSATQSKVADLYNITGIPFSILVDPDGKIVAKNLRGELLHSKLAEIYD